MENEVELIRGCRDGEDTARKQLYTLYARQMLAVCYRYTGDIDAAHDVLHDGFIKIFTRFTFRGESSLKTWMVRVMVTQAIDYLRRQKRTNMLFVADEEISDMSDLPDLSTEDHTEEIPEIKLLEFVAELPEGCRMVFNLYVFEQKSHKEIGKLLGIKEHSSTSQLCRAKFLLANRIKEYRKNEERT